MQASKGAVVTLQYSVKDQEGNQIDPGAEPMVYLHGGDQARGLFPKIQDALDGKTIGDSVEVTLAPDDAFGAYDPELVMEEPRELFPEGLEAGMVLRREDEGGQSQLFLVAHIGETMVKVDGNHPLAGKSLVFAATIEMIRPANPGEIESGVPEM